MRELKQSSTAQPLMFLLVQSADHITGLTGATPTVTLSKSGGAFASPAGAVSEVANGWYKVAGNATDTGTLGPLILHATAVGADPTDVEYEIVAYDPQVAKAPVTLAATDVTGNVPTDVQTIKTQTVTAGAGVTVGAFVGNATAAISVDASGRIDIGKALGTAVTLDANNVLNVSTKYLGGTLQTARDIGASVLLSAGTGTGQLDFTNGVAKANLVQILTTALTETAGQIAAAFKKFFDISTPTSTANRITLVDTATVATTATNLTNLPAVPTDWLAAAGVKADAVTKIQAGLATPTNITAGTITTVTNLTNPATVSSASLQSIATSVWGFKRILYVSKSGNDSTGDGLSPATAWLTVFKAKQNAIAGDLILIGPGTFDEGSTNSLQFADGVNVSGTGIYSTTIKSSKGTHPIGFYLPGSNSIHQDFTVDIRVGDTGAHRAFGPKDSDAATTNVLVRRVRAMADSTAFSVQVAGCSNWRFEDIQAVCYRDVLAVSGAGTTVDVFRATLDGTGPALDHSSRTIGVTSSNGSYLRVFDSAIRAINGYDSTTLIGLTAAAASRTVADGTAKLELHNCDLYGHDPAAPATNVVAYDVLSDYDVDSLSTSLSTVLMRDVKHDPTTVSAPAGALTYINTPINQANQVGSNAIADVQSTRAAKIDTINTNTAAQAIANALNTAPTGTPAAGSVNKTVITNLDAKVSSVSGGSGGAATITFSQAAAAIGASPASAGTISIRRGDTVSQQLTGLGNITSRTKLWFTAKTAPATDADTASVLQVEETAGALYVAGATASASNVASLTVNDATNGDITLVVRGAASALMTPANLTYDVQMLTTSGPVTLASGDFRVPADVTRAVS